ncbi:MAG: hypothetical protein NVSMB60_16620 [Mycobacterium sp.]
MTTAAPTVLTGATTRSANRRGAEVLLLVFAAVITMTALVTVDVNQHQPLSLDLLRYLGAYLALSTMAHIAVRRFARYADPLLLPVVALLNGLGVIMIYRLGLPDTVESPGGNHRSAVEQQLLWTLLAVMAFTAVVWLLADYRILARYGYVCGTAGVVLLAVPAVLPASLSEQNGAKIWVRLPDFSVEPAEFSTILLLGVRVHNWLDPFVDANGVGYQMVQSLFSFATGGVFGTGLGNGSPARCRWRRRTSSSPHSARSSGWSDCRRYGCPTRSSSCAGCAPPSPCATASASCWPEDWPPHWASSCSLWSGGVTNFIPQTGLTTPWLSYGGSSLLANHVLLAVLVRISHAARRPIRKPVRTVPIAAAHTEVMKRAR